MPVIALLIGAVLAAADQLFKMLIVNNFTLGETRPLIPNILNLTYIRNEGVAFGMFSGMSWLFIVLTVLLLSFIIFYMFRKRPDSKLFYFSVALVIGGGLGNLIDRCWRSICSFSRIKRKRKNSMTAHKLTCESAGVRLDKFLADAGLELSRSMAVTLIENGNVTVNGKPCSKKQKLSAGDTVDVTVPDAEPYEAKAEQIPLDIVYEDADLLVVNKPKGMVVHPAAGNYEGTLVNALLWHCGDSLSGINGVLRPGIVHRIDKDTSGLLIVAKNDRTHKGLAEQIKAHSFTREYEAVVFGSLRDDEGTVDAPIGRHPVDRKKMCVTQKNSKNAVTHYRVLSRYQGYTHIRCVLETGRTHQIRVHMAYLGHPVAGDPVYGVKNERVPFSGQCLHAKKIGFVHPVMGAYMEFDSELPPYFQAFLHKLQNISK